MKNIKWEVLLLIFCSMGFMLLLVVGLMERTVVSLLFDSAANVAEEDIRLTFSALQRIVGVLPYTLGVIVLSSAILSIVQGVQTQWNVYSIIVILFLFLPMIYNIFLADTAIVVENLKNTTPSDEISLVKKSLMAAVQQHYIGLSGFGLAFLTQIFFVFKKM